MQPKSDHSKMQIKAYFDNVVASGLVTGDLGPTSEMQAVRDLQIAHSDKRIELVTSRESWREQEHTRSAGTRALLEGARPGLTVVPHDHVFLGSENQMGRYGTIATNVLVDDVVDGTLFADLKAIGLKEADARHFMYAFSNNCNRFVTLDPDFGNCRVALETRCPTLKIVTPTQLLAELQAKP